MLTIIKVLTVTFSSKTINKVCSYCHAAYLAYQQIPCWTLVWLFHRQIPANHRCDRPALNSVYHGFHNNLYSDKTENYLKLLNISKNINKKLTSLSFFFELDPTPFWVSFKEFPKVFALKNFKKLADISLPLEPK